MFNPHHAQQRLARIRAAATSNSKRVHSVNPTIAHDQLLELQNSNNKLQVYCASQRAQIQKLEKESKYNFWRGQRVVLDEWQDSFSVLNSLDISLGCGLTVEQWTLLRFQLSFDRDVNTWVSKRIPNSNFNYPSLVSRQVLAVEQTTILEEMGITSLKSGVGETFDVGTIVQLCLEQSAWWRDDQGKHHMQVVADGHKLGKNSFLINCAIRALYPHASYNQTRNLNQVWALEGEENFDSLKEGMERIHKHIELTAHSMVWWVGGDAHFLSECMGLGAHFDSVTHQNCPWCNVPSKELGKLPRVYTTRTLTRIRNLAHLPHNTSTQSGFPFDCPGCKTSFANEGDITSDKKGPRKVKAGESEYRRKHESVTWHREPLLPIEPNNYVCCMLHEKLNNAKYLYACAIMPHITKDNHMALHLYLKSVKVLIKKPVAVARSQSAPKQKKPPAFTGNMVNSLIENFDTAMRQVTNDEAKISAALYVVNKYITLRNAITDRCTEETKNQKADLVQKLADEYVVAFGNWVGEEKCKYYHHFLSHHVADQIRILPVDITNAGGDGVERLNQLNKQASQKTNWNRKLTRAVSKGKNRIGKTQSAGKRFTAQILLRRAAQGQRLRKRRRSAWFAREKSKDIKREKDFLSGKVAGTHFDQLPVLDHSVQEP